MPPEYIQSRMRFCPLSETKDWTHGMPGGLRYAQPPQQRRWETPRSIPSHHKA